MTVTVTVTVTATGHPADGHLARPAAEVSVDLSVTARAVARRLAAGGTLWCLSPNRPALSARLATLFRVEGAAAQDLLWSGATSTLRTATRPDDVVLLLGPAADPTLADLARRGPVWGALTVWMGSGDRPSPGAADHVLFCDDLDAVVDQLVGRGRELLLAGADALAPPPACDGPVCITCSDEGRLAEVVEVSGPTAQVRTAQGREEVDLTLVGRADPYDLLVVHAGTAITRLERQNR